MEKPQMDNNNKKTMSNKNIEIELGQNEEALVEAEDYSKRAQWLRAAVLGANDGLLSTASLMMGIGAVRRDAKIMLLTGAAGLVAGACSMAIGEFVSVYSQLDIEVAQMKREKRGREERNLPSPVQAAGASAAAFTVGAGVPLLAAAFARDYRVRLGAVVAAVSVALIGFGWAAAALGRAPPVRAAMRVLVGGWVAMGITFGLTKLIGYTSGI
ncbi:vacuolar iron transporter homolog 4-like [Salvia hispanica]|uniref:vacuolar iron transporter homolog 4-like n=1 Tax=Salvia hispanica TaxID=49212 RepID=UPI002009DA9A|nr:vacuolar iron transporter homolog 4-like [Salvia hispanica]